MSHAHADHLPSKNGGTIFHQLKQVKLQILVGFKMENHIQFLDEFSLIDSGHILEQKVCFLMISSILVIYVPEIVDFYRVQKFQNVKL